jgi:hypothetical protein
MRRAGSSFALFVAGSGLRGAPPNGAVQQEARATRGQQKLSTYNAPRGGAMASGARAQNQAWKMPT